LNSNGVVHFSNTSVIPSSTNHYWDFGDGIYSLASSPTHTYSNAGTYFVTLTEKDSLHSYCNDTLMQAINVTGISCVANGNFTLFPSGTPQYWTAIPAYPWNVTAASWSWGDGTLSNSLYASHLYSVASTYSICLSVTVSCGSSATYCMPYYVSKPSDPSSQVISVNVVPPDKLNGIGTFEGRDHSFSLYPNPNDGCFTVDIGDTEEAVTLTVYDLVGNTIYTSALQRNKNTVKLDEISAGIYFVQLRSGGSSQTQKIIIGK
jgi:PKD repeat protein